MKKLIGMMLLSAALATGAAAQTAPAPGPAAPQARPEASPPAAAGGNKALMDEWATRRREVRDKVLSRLREQGRVPRDGTVEFEARFRPDPKDPAKLFVAVDAVRVTPFPPGKAPGKPEHVDGKAGTQAIDLALAPIEVPSRVELRNLDVPIAVAFKESVTIREGSVDESPAFAPAPAPAPGLTGGGADAAGDGADQGVWARLRAWWHKMVNAIGL
ncbi:MAG: hypothetical protein ACOY4F_11770 [Thermodesulfobacteriota bacterium]